MICVVHRKMSFITYIRLEIVSGKQDNTAEFVQLKFGECLKSLNVYANGNLLIIVLILR